MELTPLERRALEIVSEVLVEIRHLARYNGSLEAIAALAQSVHNTPRLVAEGKCAAMAELVTFELGEASNLLARTSDHSLSPARLAFSEKA